MNLFENFPDYEKQSLLMEVFIIKEIEQNQLTWYSHVQRIPEGRLPKLAWKTQSVPRCKHFSSRL